MMLYQFSLPTKADKVPTGPQWLHEIKFDGYRMMVVRRSLFADRLGRAGAA
jgi:bifunctional non-homologous end joining protein LigD